MSTNVQRSMGGVLSVGFLALTLTLAGCGQADAVVSGTLGDEAFVRVARTSQALTADAGTDGYASNENFYLALNKSQLGSKWFLAAYLTQWHPAEAGMAARSLGSRVVSFKLQNGKLYVFDVTDGAKWSDTLDPQRVVEAYPLVTDFAPFNAMAGSGDYVLFDPSAGLNRFEVLGDVFAASFSARFEVELSYLQHYKVLGDGVAFEQVFAGYTEIPGPGLLGFDQPFRGQGTMAISLRRYTEGAGFTAAELPNNHYFGSENIQYVPNEPRAKQNVVKWNLKPGMQPIPWRISQAVARLKADPRLAGVDIEGAIARGITGWNDALGFPAFSVVTTAPGDSFGDDDKNFVVVDTNPGLGMAFANWRENPNTGEIRGASVYFSSVFIEGALQSAAEGAVDAGTPVVDAGAPGLDAGLPAGDAGVPDAGPAPVNDRCAAPQPMIVGFPTPGTLLASTAEPLFSGAPASCSAPSMPRPDVFYSLTVPAGRTATITVFPAAGTDTFVNVLASTALCSGVTACVAKNDSGLSGEPDTAVFSNDSGASQTVLVQVGGWTLSNVVLGDFVITATLSAPPPSPVCAPALSIAQVFGGNSATGYRNQDFVMLHNRTSAPVALSGMSLQYGSASGTSAWQVIALSGVVPADGSFLVGLATVTGGTAIPTPDLVSGINISAANGKLALVQNTTALTGACALTSSVIDAVGYGVTNCSELRAAPSPGSAASIIRADLLGCVDSNDNQADFVTSTLEPKNAASTPSAPCVCAAPAVSPTPAPSPVGMPSGGVQLVAPARQLRPQLRWGSMAGQSLCSFEAPKAAIPAGMTRKEFLEKYITEIILHEVGHTLGLRHNFKGSLERSSVMDYNIEADAVLFDRPGPYDVAAVRLLYGLSTAAPTQAFCTDEDTLTDAQCDRFDATANPLTNQLAPRYRQLLRDTLAERSQLTFAQIFAITRYVRGAANEQQRLEAFNVLIGDVAPPLAPDVIALGPNAAAWANQYNAALLQNLFVAPVEYRDPVAVNPAVNDPAFRARVLEVVRNSLLSSDGYRSFDTMRTMVDVLKAMQHGDAFAVLTEARNALAAGTYDAATQPYVTDLIRRIDVATSPYFY
ncbi:MAG: zinc-dependent metalloprotease [Archangium sp.]|nr:zinc-dependent metalloprotease [Archangium sp.]